MGGGNLKSILTCPNCGSTSIETDNNSERNSMYRCLNCRTRFGYKDYAKNEYSNKLMTFSMSVRRLLDDCFRIRVTKNKDEDGASFFITKNGIEKLIDGALDKNQWNEFKSILFNDLYLDKWKKLYFDPNVEDGIKWELEVTFEKKHALFFSGCNGYPIYWNGLLDVLKKFFPHKNQTYDEFRI